MHTWNLTPQEAIALQKQLATQIEITHYAPVVRYIGGADISFNRGSDEVFAGIVVLDFSSLAIVEQRVVRTQANFPYIPGLLSFRELPPLLEVWEQLTLKPDVLMLDGQGLAHPRRFGLACHMGLWLNIPTLGCAKTHFIGEYTPPAETQGSYSELMDSGSQLGYVLRTKTRVKPVFISPGHRVALEQSLEWALAATGKYRIPEPTRQAHLAVNAARKAYYG